MSEKRESTEEDPMTRALSQLKESNTESQYEVLVTRLAVYLRNLTKNPTEDKYRRIRRQNKLFQRDIGQREGSHDCMLAAGFVVEEEDGVEYYRFPALVESGEPWDSFLRAQSVVDQENDRFAEERKRHFELTQQSQEELSRNPNDDRPRKALSAFLIFCRDHRERLQSEHPDANFVTMAKILSRAYNALSEEERASLEEQSVADKERYNRETENYVCLAEKTWNARIEFLHSLGTEPFGFTVPIMPSFMSLGMGLNMPGIPRGYGTHYFWPDKPGWIQLKIPSTSEDLPQGRLCVSNGLTQPWEEHSPVDFGARGFPNPNLGFGFEVIFGTTDTKLSDENIKSIVMEISNNMAADPHGRLALFQELGTDEQQLMTNHPEFATGNDADETSSLPRVGCMSMEINASEFPESLQSPSMQFGKSLGILISGTITEGLPSFIELPQGRAYLLELTILHPEELAHIQACSYPARLEIFHRLQALNQKWCSSSTRPSVVPVPPPKNPCSSEEEVIQVVKSWPPMP